MKVFWSVLIRGTKLYFSSYTHTQRATILCKCVCEGVGVLVGVVVFHPESAEQ